MISGIGEILEKAQTSFTSEAQDREVPMPIATTSSTAEDVILQPGG